MSIANKITDWLESRWVTPSYAGWLIGGLAVFFFGAATNTMVGWLYVISGVSIALLGIAAILPARSLKGIQLRRRPIEPVSAGDGLTVEIEIFNQSAQPKTLLQVQDVLPFVLGKPVRESIETIEANDSYKWTYYYPTTQRGIYRWHTVVLRTASPLGLFYCRRQREARATAVVYPIVLPLSTCPIVDRLGTEDSLKFRSDRRGFQTSTEGITRGLRPYRVGDPTRLIHWRSSARYGDLRVRELEVITGGQEVVICLDSASAWDLDRFEQAAIAAASLYYYAAKRQMNVKLWTAGTGLLQGHRVVLEALAATYASEEVMAEIPVNLPLIWLTQSPHQLNSLPIGSRWLLWKQPGLTETSQDLVNPDSPGLTIDPEQLLQVQLQQQIR